MKIQFLKDRIAIYYYQKVLLEAFKLMLEWDKQFTPIVLISLLVACNPISQEEKYFSGATEVPVVFEPGTISTAEFHESGNTFALDSKAFYSPEAIASLILLHFINPLLEKEPGKPLRYWISLEPFTMRVCPFRLKWTSPFLLPNVHTNKQV